jgi:rhamnose transport system ATP-binding protein
MYPRAPHRPDAPVVLSATDIQSGDSVQTASLCVRAGEIVGLFGLVGSGRTQLARAMFGADRIDHGTVTLAGEEINPKTPRAAIRAGLALLPEDRRGQGLCLGRSIADNLTLPHAAQHGRGGFLRQRQVRQTADELMKRLDIRAPTAAVSVGMLSGGNQQKVLLGKWLAGAPTALIVDEPTRGVDVGAKRTIHELLVNAAAKGLGLLLISSDIEEVLGLAHRVLVMRKGHVVAEFNASCVEKEEVLMAAFQSMDDEDGSARP